MNEIPKVVYLHAEWNKYGKDWRYSVDKDDDRSYLGEILIGKADVAFEVTVPTEQLTKEQVKLFREEQSKIRAAAERQCVEIEDKIQGMLALPAPKKEEDDFSF